MCIYSYGSLLPQIDSLALSNYHSYTRSQILLRKIKFPQKYLIECDCC
jgi:hypothetical protein